MTELSAGNNEIRIKPLQLIILFAVLQFVIAFLTDPMMLTFDESMWHYIGRNWIRNRLIPYAGGIDNKSPLIFFIFGISDWLFGVNYWFPLDYGNFSAICRNLWIIQNSRQKQSGRERGYLR